MTSTGLLFFTGGTALRDLSRQLAQSDQPSTHLVTTFDSGGSSAKLRDALAIPAVGDVRNRLLALADTRIVPFNLLQFCGLRLPADCPESADRARLLALGNKNAPVWQTLPRDSAEILRSCLEDFLKRMPPAFDSRGASLGNLMLAGAYLRHKRDFGPVLNIFNNLLHTRGRVLPITNISLNLGARLADGSIVIGQHLFKNLAAPVESIFLTVHQSQNSYSKDRQTLQCEPEISREIREAIKSARAICYPMGSFYSSVLANLLLKGVGRTVAGNRNVKIYIPNTGEDPESRGLSLPGKAAAILRYLRKDAPGAPTEKLLQYVLVDRQNGRYNGGSWQSGWDAELAAMGLQVADKRIVLPDNPQKHDAAALLGVLCELADRS